MRKVILPSLLLGLFLSACQSNAPWPVAQKQAVMKAQDVSHAVVTGSKSVGVTYTDASGRDRGVITVTSQIRREADTAYAVLTYSDTTDIGGFGPFQTGTVELRNLSGQKLESSFRYGLNGPTRVYSLITTYAYTEAELSGPLCAAVRTELYDATDSTAPRVPLSFTVCETEPLPPLPPVDPYADARLTATLTKNKEQSRVQINLADVPAGTTMDGVYTLSLDPACDVTGQRTKDKVLFQGDFWTEKTTGATEFTDKLRHFVNPATSLLVSARVIDPDGTVIKELETSTCLR